MGRVVNQSLHDCRRNSRRDGRTMTAEAVEYPAVPVPGETAASGRGSASSAASTPVRRRLGEQYAAFVAAVPDLQGGAGRLLAGRDGRAPQSASARRKPEPGRGAAGRRRRPAARRIPTLNLGTASGIPERGKGVAQDWPILAHAPGTAVAGHRRPHDQRLRSRRCRLRLQPTTMNPQWHTREAVAIHTSYATHHRPGLDTAVSSQPRRTPRRHPTRSRSCRSARRHRRCRRRASDPQHHRTGRQ